jgi:LysR family hydrogen peroxide-inducible transcriptional activator
MNLQEMRYIVALDDTRHFGQAARACFISQPTWSSQIKKLEDYLGVALFDRSLKNVTPTAIGREIIASARLIVQESNHILELAQGSLNPMSRDVRLGVIPTLGPYFLPRILPWLHDTFPSLKLLLREEMTPHILADLANGRLDAGLLVLPLKDPALESIPLFVEPFFAAVPADHPLAEKAAININELAQAKLLLLEEGHCLRDQALDICQLERPENEEMRATSLETLRQMVALGYGVTLIPALAGDTPQDYRNRIRIIPLNASGASRTVGLVWRRRSYLDQTLVKLAEALKAQLPACVFAAA